MQEQQQKVSPLTLRDSLDLALKAGDKIDIGWRQYFTVVFALLAYASSNLAKIGQADAIFLTVGIALFAVVNCFALVRAYILLGLITREANAIVQMSSFLDDDVQSYTRRDGQKFKFSMRIPMAVVAHFLAAAAISYLAWSEVPGFALRSLLN